MREVKKKHRVFDPIRSIEWAISVCTAFGGLFVFSPLYAVQQAQTGPSVFASALAHPAMILLFGAILFIGASFVMLGLARELPHFRSMGWFAIILARTFQLLTTWLTVGLIPVTWIFPFTIAIVAVILWYYARGQVERLNNGGS